MNILKDVPLRNLNEDSYVTLKDVFTYFPLNLLPRAVIMLQQNFVAIQMYF